VNEAWKIVPGFPDYEVSTHGRIRRLRAARCCRWPAGYIKRPYMHKDGYLRTALTDAEGRLRRFTVHRLVLTTFVGARPIGTECNHKNCVKSDNRLENLEWITPKENSRHAKQNGRLRYTPLKGTKNGNAILTDDIVREMRRLYATGRYTTKELGLRFGVAGNTAGRAVNGTGWTHI
jgi:hypothetical protein